jgi:hypothetical protein
VNGRRINKMRRLFLFPAGVMARGDPDPILDEVETPIGFAIRRTSAYWSHVFIVKHPALAGHEADVERALRDPDEVRRSRKDASVYRFDRGVRPRGTCAVARHAERIGFVVTAYPTDAIKAGEQLPTLSIESLRQSSSRSPFSLVPPLAGDCFTASEKRRRTGSS